MTARELLKGIVVIEEQLRLFLPSGHANRAAVMYGLGVLEELSNLVRDTKADELEDDNVVVGIADNPGSMDRELQSITDANTGTLEGLLDLGQSGDTPTG